MEEEGKKSNTRKRGRRHAKQHPSRMLAQENRDLFASLEHLIATGCQQKHEMERRKEFREFQELLMEQQHSLPWAYMQEEIYSGDEDNHSTLKSISDWNTGGTVDEDSLKPAASTKVPRKQVFQEDIRIYGEIGVGKEGFPKPPWPKQQKKHAIKDNRKMNNSDINWEVEHGDSIHPLAFAVTRLSESKLPTTATELKTINGYNLNVSTTDTSLSENDVPRALLLRCWERAVHASSMTVPIHLNLETQNRPPQPTDHRQTQAHRHGGLSTQDETSSIMFGNSVLGLGEPTDDTPILRHATPVVEPSFVAFQRHVAGDRKATEAKCTSLGVAIPKIVPNLTCPVCFRAFESSKVLRAHYYGERTQKGCCWQRINEKQTDVIGQVLEAHVKLQIDEFIGLVIERAKERVIEPADRQTSGKRRRLLNWHDILKFAEKTMHSSSQMEESEIDCQNGLHPIYETFQHKSNGLPLLLNPTVLQTVRQRLVDRYAKLPL